jgi:Na+-transporting methylmalonyl-CoA/oxaloacetate decarboxylase beta subunit
MDVINQGAAAINDGVAYLRKNAWPIVLMLCLWFYLKPKGVVSRLSSSIRAKTLKIAAMCVYALLLRLGFGFFPTTFPLFVVDLHSQW